MKSIYLNANKIFDKEIEFIPSVVRLGKILIIPTDTIYGLSALARDKKAVDKIYKIKKRERNKPLILLMNNFAMVRKYCYLKKDQYAYMKKEINKGRPVTFILKNKSKELIHLTNEKGGISVRIPVKNLFLMKLLKKINDPIVSTSLNISGEDAILDLKNLSDKIDVSNVDLIVDIGKIRRSKSSRVVDIMDMDNMTIIRK